jgi:ketopantoate reductase
MTNPSVLIVGAGALGVSTGYYLHLAGADVTFLVRENRLAALSLPQILYSYDDGQLKTFSAYQTASDLGALAQTRFDFVLVTLDGAACRSAEGTKLLAGIADMIRGSEAVIIICGVGVRGHYLATTRLPENRILEGTLGNLAYQVDRVKLPLHPPTDPALLARAAFAYHHFKGAPGFMLAAKPRAAAKAFAALYNKSGISKAAVMKAELYAIVSSAFFPVTAICDLAGWPAVNRMSANKELMRLGSGAMREMIALPEHGWVGRISSPLLQTPALNWLLKKMYQASLPLDFNAFNRFHHGGKVRAQDLQVMQNCLASGLAQGRKMPALGELVARYERHCAAT